MKAVLKTKCGSEREVDVQPEHNGSPPVEFRVPILLSQPRSLWAVDVPIDPIGPTYCNRVFRCEMRRDDRGRVIYSEYVSAESMTEQERWDANIEWPAELQT